MWGRCAGKGSARVVPGSQARLALLEPPRIVVCTYAGSHPPRWRHSSEVIAGRSNFAFVRRRHACQSRFTSELGSPCSIPRRCTCMPDSMRAVGLMRRRASLAHSTKN
ncbi:hypothetical protein C8Q73DRAFT_202634 [Cubamyces lactineus]|nr:hypothetical protein C8Q73DRAFT_202634 [Cubamyces lactineus]